MLDARDTSTPDPARIADRYDVHAGLGRGGMARVYRVTDRSSGQELALKQLQLPADPEQRRSLAALFQREFHTLAQLRHPRVIAVYDYGVSEFGPYYTMELLDGGDLRDRSPLPWRECCALFFDVCSSLALLHSRRLLHHDISPRNIRCTPDGKAKLIDFGALAPIGFAGLQVVGTPAFIAPETLQRALLDARADLFSLGATLYYALTGELAYYARTFGEASEAWNSPPVPPSAHVEGIPPELDELLLSLLSPEPALRPRSAFEVMQRLAASADLPCNEGEDVSRAYLATPTLVGREPELAGLRDAMMRALQNRGGGMLVRSAPGLGRSRLLDACALEAKALGTTVLRASADGTQTPFALVFELLRHVFSALPIVDAVSGSHGELRALEALRDEPEQLQQRLCRQLLDASKTRALVVIVDDVQRIDEPSAAALAALLDAATSERICVAMSVDADSEQSALAIEVLASRCQSIQLQALNAVQTQALLGSVFGDVQNIDLVADEIHRIAQGNPRQTMDLAQHLLDRRVVTYAAGAWTLPSQLATGDLPRSAADALHARVAGLSPHARFLAEAHSLAFYERVTHADYHALCPDLDPRSGEAAIAELIEQQLLNGDAQAYSIANRVWIAALQAGLDATRSEACHRALARMYGGRFKRAAIHHLFRAGLDEEGLDALLSLHAEYSKGFDAKIALDVELAKLGPCYQRAIEIACKLGRPARRINDLRQWCTALSAVASHTGYYWSSAPAWLAQLVRDSGLAFWREDTETADPAARLTRALQRAFETYQATPESERVYRVDEAIPLLAEYVAFSIAVGSRTMDGAILTTLPGLLEPFTALSPILEALWQNAIASCECAVTAQYDQARDRWLAVLAKLEKVSGAELQHVESIRNAIAFGVGILEASFGLASAARWAELMEHNPYHRLSALNLRKVVRLEQGDWNGAERLRRQAELLALQARSPQMFYFSLTIEISAHAHARDLLGVKQIIARYEELAAEYECWVPFLRDAQARFQLLRGDFAAARASFEQCIALTALDEQHHSRMLLVWVSAQAGLAESLLALDCVEQARASAQSALALCEELEIGSQANELVRALAVAEAKQADFAAASQRIERLIERQLALGASGLRLGLSYETRALIAIWQGDLAAFERYARLTAREYRYGAGSPLGTRYARLMHEARRYGVRPVEDIASVSPG
jgi:hypothetical protein